MTASMANDDASTPADANAAQTTIAVNGTADEDIDHNERGEDKGAEFLDLTVKLPHAPYKAVIMVSSQEQVQDIRQSIIDLPSTFQYSCFHLEHRGKRVNDFVELSDVSDIAQHQEITLIEDPYTEKEARLHVARVRDLIGAVGDRTDTLHGISAGCSLHDTIPGVEHASTGQPNSSSNDLPTEGYTFDGPGDISVLVPPQQQPAPKTIKAFSISPWNPPPYQLRAKGHLLYLLITTNEGEQYQITSHISGFYVNKSSNSKFDPFPRASPKDCHSHSLITLLGKISPSFNGSFTALQEYNNKRDPLTAFQLSNATPASPWLVAPHAAMLNNHQSDVARSQENYLLGGLENNETLRDWNEEFQTTRELPRETVRDRVFRERLTSKLFADYNEAASRGAVLVARGEITPLNPTEGRDAQIYVHNGIFFSFGADGVGTFATDGGDEAARIATGKDVVGVRTVNQLDIVGLFLPGTVVVDYLGKRIVGQSIVPGIFKQREPGEPQIDYGGVEGKDTVAENEGFVPLFKKLSEALRVKRHGVWDKEHKRHDLEASVETKGLLGTDGRKYVLDLYRLTPLDIAWLEENWTEVDTKVEEKPKEKNYPHRMAVLRQELIETYRAHKLRHYIREEFEQRQSETKAEQSKDRKSDRDAESKEASTTQDEQGLKPTKEEQEIKNSRAEQESVDISNFSFSLNPDVFSGQEPQTEDEKAEMAKDEEDVRAACQFLATEVIPQTIEQLRDGDVGFPMDGQSLSSLLHKRGINIRYLGHIAKLADASDLRLQALKRLAVQEMIARGFKHVANKRLRYLPVPFAGVCVAHLLNCFLGAETNSSPKTEIDETLRSMFSDADFSFEKATPSSVKEEVKAQVYMRYRYDLGDSWIEKGRYLQMLREVSLKLGLQLEAKTYNFLKEDLSNGHTERTTGTEAANGHSSSSKKKKKGADSHSPTSRSATPTQAVSFHADDILNIVPVVKEAAPRSILAEEALEAGRMSLAQDQMELGQELLMESLSLHEQVYGILHPEVAKFYGQLASIYFSLEHKDFAVDLGRKAVIVSERTLGVDSAETVLNYLNLGLFEHNNGNARGALAYVRHALELWKVIYGPKHPDSITTLNNAAVMLQSIKRYHESRIWFEASLAICEEVSGNKSINTATLLFQVSQALALDKDTRAAVDRMRECRNIFNDTLGPEDRNTKEAASWLDSLTHSAVALAKQARDQEQKKLLRRPHVTLGARPLPPVGQTTADATSGRLKTSPSAVDTRTIDELVKYINEGDSKKSKSTKGPANPKRRAQR